MEKYGLLTAVSPLMDEGPSWGTITLFTQGQSFLMILLLVVYCIAVEPTNLQQINYWRLSFPEASTVTTILQVLSCLVRSKKYFQKKSLYLFPERYVLKKLHKGSRNKFF